MRKGIRAQHAQHVSATDRGWLDLPQLAKVELTSDPAYPIEAAFLPGTGSGWRAAQPGEQTIRLLFDQPQRVRRIQLLFHEHQRARTQEFPLRCSRDSISLTGRSCVSNITLAHPARRASLKITRSIWPSDGMELKIVPDISGGEARRRLPSSGSDDLEVSIGTKTVFGGIHVQITHHRCISFPAAVLAAQSAVVLDTLQMPNAHQSIAAHAPIRLSMGPDPGGKTGATVNPETTKTGLPSGDSATTPTSSGASGATGNRAQGASQSSDPANSEEQSKHSGTDSSAGDSANTPANGNRSDTNR